MQLIGNNIHIYSFNGAHPTHVSSLVDDVTIHAVAENKRSSIKHNYNSELTIKKNEIKYTIKIGLIHREHG